MIDVLLMISSPEPCLLSQAFDDWRTEHPRTTIVFQNSTMIIGAVTLYTVEKAVFLWLSRQNRSVKIIATYATQTFSARMEFSDGACLSLESEDQTNYIQKFLEKCFK
jgi:hypothetical protein